MDNNSPLTLAINKHRWRTTWQVELKLELLKKKKKGQKCYAKEDCCLFNLHGKREQGIITLSLEILIATGKTGRIKGKYKKKKLPKILYEKSIIILTTH